MSYQFLSISSHSTHGPVYLHSDAAPTDLTQLIEAHNQEIASAIPQERQFDYTVLQTETNKYHLLSSIRRTNENGLIIHHLALTEEEADIIRNLEQRITPVGLIISLQQAEFWYHNQTDAPESLPHIPELTKLPEVEASTQETWKRLSGHKANACAFFTSPYDAQCLFSVPATLNQHDILMLIHESTWLMPARGWGKSFTVGNNSDTFNFKKTQLIVIQNTAPASSTAPVLVLSSSLSLGNNVYSESRSTYHSGDKGQEHLIDHGDEHYKYTECADEDIYNIPNHSLRNNIIKAASLLMLSTLLIGGAIYGYNTYLEQHPQENTGISAQQKLAEILRKPQPTKQDFIKLKATAVPDIELQESLNKLIYGPDKTNGHPENLLYLIRQAKSHKLPSKQILCYYLESATSTYTTEDWIQQNTQPEVLRCWNTFFREYPAAVSIILHHPGIQPYMKPIIGSPIRKRKR